MMKVVVKLEFADDRMKQKAMRKVSDISGLESIAIDSDKKLTVTGGMDPMDVMKRLRKLCRADIVSVGPAKEPEKKKEEPKKDDPAQMRKAFQQAFYPNPYYSYY